MDENENISPPHKSGRITRKTLLISGSILVLLLFAILAYLYIEKEQALKDLINIKDQMEIEITDLEQELSSMESSIQDKDLELEKKDALVLEKSREVEKLQKQVLKLVAAGKISEEKAMEQQGKIDQLTYYIRKYQNEIIELKAENEELKNRVASIEGERDSIKDRYSHARDQNTLYQVKIEGASILRASNFVFTPIKHNGKEQDSGNAFRAEKTERIKICCTINENSLAKKGMRDFYMQIKNPDGSIQTGGTFELHKKQSIYTLKQENDYQGNTMRLCFDWNPPPALSKGDYTVKIYTDGYETGNGIFSLR